MPDSISSSPVDTFMQAADQAAMRAAMGLGSTDSPTFAAVTLATTPLIGGANFLYQRNGTNPQGFYLANTYTDAANYERGFIRYNTNILQIGHEYLGTGVSRQIDFIAAGATRMSLLTNGNVYVTGSFSANANVGAGGSSYFTWSSRSAIGSGANGNIALYNSSVNDFGLLQFGGTTNSFPALKRNGSALQLRYADDAGFALLEGAGFYGYNTYTDAANYERASFGYVANVLRIGLEQLGTGVIRDFEIATNNGVSRLYISGGTGNVTIGGPLNCSNIVASSSIAVGNLAALLWTGRSKFTSPSDGVIRVSNNAGTAFTRLELAVANQGIHQGTGSPEGVVTGLVGSIFLRTDGGASTTLYVKESGTGNTGWVAK